MIINRMMNQPLANMLLVIMKVITKTMGRKLNSYLVIQSIVMVETVVVLREDVMKMEILLIGSVQNQL